jgi:hypothetical protein
MLNQTEAQSRVRILAAIIFIFPSLAFAEANGIVVFFAIAGIPILLALMGVAMLIPIPGKKSSANSEVVESGGNNENGLKNKSTVLKFLGQLISIVKFVVGIYLALLPITLFPNSTVVLVANVSLVALILLFRIKVYLSDRQ